MRHITPPWPWTKNAVFLTGHAALKWVIGGIRASRWSIGSVATKWSIGGIVTSVANQPVSISAQALEYVDVGPVVVTVNGVPVNPTADPVSMAFMATTATPGVSDWKTASWNANGTNYFAQCLVGTGGAVSLAAGNWYVWVKIQDSPELVIRQVDILNIY